MNENIHKFERSDVTSEACAWIAQLETGDTTLQDLAAFREWMQRSPRHADEIRRLAYLSDDLNILTEMAGPLEDAASHFRQIVAQRRTPLWRKPQALVAGLAAIVFMAAGALIYFAPGAYPEGSRIIATAIGDYQEITLSDGSRVELNSDTQIEVEFTRDRRKIRLLKGEAFFTVAHDPARPFVVFAGRNYVLAVGTAFAVRLFDAENDFEVTVTEGRVVVAEATGASPTEIAAPSRIGEAAPTVEAVEPAAHLLVLKAGQNVVVSSASEAPPIMEMTPRELQRKLSWQEGLFDFSETPLIEVVQEVSRHTATRIEISDPQLRNLRFGGVFRTGETDALLSALEVSFDIEVEYVDDGYVRLKPREKS